MKVFDLNHALALCKKRHEKVYTGAELSRMTGIHYQTINRFIQGAVKKPKTIHLEAIATALELTVDDLYVENRR